MARKSRSKKGAEEPKAEAKAPELEAEPVSEAPEPEASEEQAPELEAEPIADLAPEPYDEPEGPPSADELCANAPSVEEMMLMGFDEPRAKAISAAFGEMVEKVREILRPGLRPKESVQISSTDPKGHYRVGRKWIPKPALFAQDDPFLSEETVKILKSDPRIHIKFPE